MPYIGEIRMFAGSFAPAGWAFCHGQLMPISENDALFTLIGTTYGGDGQETFALPDLQGRVPVHAGTNTTTGSTYQLGERAGVESVTLTTPQIPIHSHPLMGASAATGTSAASAVPAAVSAGARYFFGTGATVNMDSPDPAGGSQPHDNMAPFVCISFIISLFGVFPSAT